MQAAPHYARSATLTTQQHTLAQHRQMHALAAHLATEAGWTAQVVCAGPAFQAHTQVAQLLLPRHVHLAQAHGQQGAMHPGA